MYPLKSFIIFPFLSTLSLRRATLLFKNQIIFHHNYFYPRSPCGERLLIQPIRRPESALFLSTLSLRRATLLFYAACFALPISIHALLAESDLPAVPFRILRMLFLSTLSLRRATVHYDNYNLHCVISIHALLAESDSKSAQNSGALLRI